MNSIHHQLTEQQIKTFESLSVKAQLATLHDMAAQSNMLNAVTDESLTALIALQAEPTTLGQFVILSNLLAQEGK